MEKSLSIALAQLNWLVGDIEGNTERILASLVKPQFQQCDMVVFSELALTGYPPEDLLYRQDFYERCQTQLSRICEASKDIAIVIGHPHREDGRLYNALSIFWKGALFYRYYKQKLPNYGVFDEERYFSAGKRSGFVQFKGYKLGLLICEDLWFDEPIDHLADKGAELLISINASPYSYDKPYVRQNLLVGHCQRTHLPLIYLNQVGGQDELIFDGGSKVLNASGHVTHQLAYFEEESTVIQIKGDYVEPMLAPSLEATVLNQIYDALVLGLRDYVQKNRFKGVILGLSGGIDSALTMAIAVDALGAENVHAVMMPFRYTSSMSVEDAQEQAKRQGVTFNIVSIEPMYEAFMQQLTPLFEGQKPDTTEENLQARCRGVLLMALSNKRGLLVLTTSNKSEVAVGYSTLYGDMVGGFAVLKDVYKTLVYRLANYRNQCSYVIPERVITRPPSAELAPGQTDQDSLPEYAVLDEILKAYLERDEGVDKICQHQIGVDENMVRRVMKLVDINEYKRRQSAIGPKITGRSFGRERRYPITSGFGRKNW